MVSEVGDSLHLRRFCLIALGEQKPDESTVRKLTRRLGSEVADELTRQQGRGKSGENRLRASKPQATFLFLAVTQRAFLLAIRTGELRNPWRPRPDAAAAIRVDSGF